MDPKKFPTFSATFTVKTLSNPMFMDDRALVVKVLNGDRQAFVLLIKQHERIVAHMVARLIKHDGEREELCQDVFMRVYEKLHEFNYQSKLSTWIATIAYRFAINHLRKKKIQVSDIPDERSFTSHFIDDENPENIIADIDMDNFVMNLIDQLPVHYKTVLTLYHVENMNYKEIGEITNMPEGTVKNYLFRARALLKERVSKYIGKEELL